MSIYDCFTYFNEDLVLDLRFHTLNEFVDKFVIVEATRDHAGKKKKLNFNLSNFKKYSNKVIYIVVDDIPEKVGSYKKKNYHENFVRENYHRNCISRGLTKASQQDLIMISDVDEIPNLTNLSKFNRKNRFAFFRQKLFRYKFNTSILCNPIQKTLFKSEFIEWLGTGICLKKYLLSPQWLRDKRLEASKILFFTSRNICKRLKRFLKYKFLLPQIINNGGWHFSSVLSPEDMRLKLKSFSHGEFNKDEFISLEIIRTKLDNNIDIFDSRTVLQSIEIDNVNFPSYILKNRARLAHFIA
jgi:beta-1,4-mannosyl-glycoprotein beta-1,4-N-acetylglucosaminyltransferase